MPAPVNRVEGAATEEAAGSPAAAKTPSASGGFQAWLPLIVMVILMPGLAWVMTTMVIIPKLQKGAGASPAPAVAAGAPASEAGAKPKKEGGAAAKKETVAMNKLLVNVAGTMGARYLLVSLSVVGSSANFHAQMEEHDAQLRDMAQSALATKTLADLEKPTTRNLIRNELMAGFNNILGDGSVEEIYFPEYAIQ